MTPRPDACESEDLDKSGLIKTSNRLMYLLNDVINGKLILLHCLSHKNDEDLESSRIAQIIFYYKFHVFIALFTQSD